MSDNIKKRVWLIDAGNMAVAYTKVLKDLEPDFLTIGNSQKEAEKYNEKTERKTIVKGLDNYLNSINESQISNIAIVSTPALTHKNVTESLIKAGVKNILIEKPGVLNIKEDKVLNKLAREHEANVRIAYNRRFYASVRQLQECIKNDGGCTSLNFEFTERSYLIKTLDKDERIKQKWVIANSTHVIDTAFFIAGLPKSLNAFVGGESDWHSAGSVFMGHGITDQNIPFSYHSDWEAPGGWRIEVMTKKNRYFLQPMEKLSFQKIGVWTKEDYPVDYTLDDKYKPGLYLMVQEFLSEKFLSFPSIENQIDAINYFNQIAGY